MGLDFSHNVLIGVNVMDKRKEIRSEDKFLPFIEGHRGVEFRIVDDYENRQFMYFGKVLANGDKYVGIERKEIDIASLDEIAEEVRKGYEEVFGEPCDPSQVKLIACTVIW